MCDLKAHEEKVNRPKLHQEMETFYSKSDPMLWLEIELLIIYIWRLESLIL